jgi:hypothetical protein
MTARARHRHPRTSRKRGAMQWYDAYLRRAYKGRHPRTLVRALNRMSTMLFGAGIGPRRAATLEVVGRSSGRLLALPVVIADWHGERYLVAMLGERANWVRNVRAARGRAVLRRGTREAVLLEDVPVDKRPPILRRYLELAPGARPHIRLDRHAPLTDFASIAGCIPVFRVTHMLTTSRLESRALPVAADVTGAAAG